MVKVPILQHLESLRDEELEERREKRRQQLAEEEEAKQNERSTSAGEESREQTLQVRGGHGYQPEVCWRRQNVTQSAKVDQYLIRANA